MKKLILIAVTAFLIAGCAKGGDRDPMEVFYEWKTEIEKDPVVTDVELFPSKSSYMHLGLELDYNVISSNGMSSFDTMITREMCKGSALPVELWIKIPGLDRNWYGEYDVKSDSFVINEIFSENDPSLTPEYRVETSTFIIWIPNEGNSK